MTIRLTSLFTALLLGAMLAFAAWTASAQVAPSAGEAAGYQGLHAAAHSGDAARIAELAAAGNDLEAKDGNGRTPVHVAAFASHEDALVALEGLAET